MLRDRTRQRGSPESRPLVQQFGTSVPACNAARRLSSSWAIQTSAELSMGRKPVGEATVELVVEVGAVGLLLRFGLLRAQRRQIGALGLLGMQP